MLSRSNFRKSQERSNSRESRNRENVEKTSLPTNQFRQSPQELLLRGYHHLIGESCYSRSQISKWSFSQFQSTNLEKRRFQERSRSRGRQKYSNLSDNKCHHHCKAQSRVDHYQNPYKPRYQEVRPPYSVFVLQVDPRCLVVILAIINPEDDQEVTQDKINLLIYISLENPSKNDFKNN